MADRAHPRQEAVIGPPNVADAPAGGHVEWTYEFGKNMLYMSPLYFQADGAYLTSSGVRFLVFVRMANETLDLIETLDNDLDSLTYSASAVKHRYLSADACQRALLDDATSQTSANRLSH